MFTCLSILAVHIEVVHTLDTDAFINALRRFIDRRGKPVQMRSDNGGNFVKRDKELREAIAKWNQEQIRDFLLQNSVDWKFNPPAASHMGGIWERTIRSVRKVVKGLLKEQTVTDKGLGTLMYEVEAILNGRPLTKVSSDPKDAEAITPSHLLFLRSEPELAPVLFPRKIIIVRTDGNKCNI